MTSIIKIRDMEWNRLLHPMIIATQDKGRYYDGMIWIKKWGIEVE